MSWLSRNHCCVSESPEIFLCAEDVFKEDIIKGGRVRGLLRRYMEGHTHCLLLWLPKHKIQSSPKYMSLMTYSLTSARALDHLGRLSNLLTLPRDIVPQVQNNHLKTQSTGYKFPLNKPLMIWSPYLWKFTSGRRSLWLLAEFIRKSWASPLQSPALPLMGSMFLMCYSTS